MLGIRMVPFWSGFTLLRHYPSQEDFGSEYELISLRKDQSCRVEPLYRLLHPLSLASCLLRLFQPTPSLEEAVVVVALALAFITVAFITVPFIVVVFIVAVFIVVQRYAVEWRWASVLLPSVQLLQEHMEPNAADTIPTQRATRALVAVIERSVTAALSPQRCRCRLPSRQQRAGTARAHRLEAIVLNPPRTMSGWSHFRRFWHVRRMSG